MRLVSAGLLTLLLITSGIACGTRPVGRSTQESLSRIAVVVRADDALQVRLDRDVTLPPDGVERLETAVRGRVSPFILEEGIRQGWVGVLREPRTFTVAPSLEVASALGALLAREDKPRYDRLVSLGVDSVLEVNVTAWGVSVGTAGAGGFGSVEARLLRLDGGRTRVLWRGRVRLDRAHAEDGPRIALSDLLDGDAAAIETLAADLSAALGRRLGDVMSVSE
jgi:hypothetical protein